MNMTGSYMIDADLAEALKHAAETGRAVPVRIDHRIYRLAVSEEPVIDTTDLWTDYDPERVRAAVRRSARLPSRVDPSELDPLIAEIRAQRDQAPDHAGF